MNNTKAASRLLFNYQKRILADDSKYIILIKSRRIGGTFIFAQKAIVEALKTNMNVWFSSNNAGNGLEFIKYVKQWAEIANTILGTEYIDLTQSTNLTVQLPNGCKISALSSAEDSLRGKDGIILLDEVAFRDDQEALFTAALGCVIQRGKVWALSSFNGAANTFYQLATDNKNQWSKHRVTIIDAINDGYARRFATHLSHIKDDKELNEAFIAELKAASINEAAYKQEYLCEPLSQQQLISNEEYDALALWDVPDDLDYSKKYNPLYIGLDIGRTKDYTVCWVMEQYRNPKSQSQHDYYDYKTVAVKLIKNRTIPEQWSELERIVKHPAVSGIGVDIGTVGRALADQVKEAVPATLMLSFSAKLKSEMAERTKGYIAYQRVSLPKEPHIKEQIIGLHRQYTRSGTLSYDGSGKEHHCDAFWALAMAIHAATATTAVSVSFAGN